jgi:geranyl-CoA carboxylase beta subunit
MCVCVREGCTDSHVLELSIDTHFLAQHSHILIINTNHTHSLTHSLPHQSHMFLAGPPLLKAATGEVATSEDLGGAEMHSEVSGTGEYLADHDADGIKTARDIVATMRPHSHSSELPAHTQHAQHAPRFDAEELLEIVPANPKTPYDVTRIIERIVDGDCKILPFKKTFDVYTVCVHARMEGHAVGVIGNNGPISPRVSVCVYVYVVVQV